LITDNKDVLFTTDEDRRRFAKQIDITHMLYAGDTGDYLQNKRENARLLGEKGLSEKHRLYEIRGVSHFDAGQVSRPDLVSQTLDLGGIFDALIDRFGFRRVILAPESKRIFEQVVGQRWPEKLVTVEFFAAGGALDELFDGQTWHVFAGKAQTDQDRDSTSLRETGVADNYRAQAGGPAMKKSPSQDVRDFGRALWVDSIEDTRNLNWVLYKIDPHPYLPTTVSPQYMFVIDELLPVTGDEFDRRFIAQQSAALTQALALAEGYARYGDDFDLKEYATRRVPKIQARLDQVRAIEMRVERMASRE